MDRRRVLKSIALSTGVVLSPVSFAGLLQAAQKNSAGDWTPVFFDKKEMQVISRLADIIFPPSDTPGALDVAVPQCIDLLMKEVFTAEESGKFRKGLHVFMRRFEQESGLQYHESPAQLQREFVEKLYSLSPDETKRILSLVAHDVAQSGAEDDYYLWSFLVTQRELVINSYFSSEEVGERVLSYDPIPGRYDACIPADDVGNAWSLSWD